MHTDHVLESQERPTHVEVEEIPYYHPRQLPMNLHKTGQWELVKREGA